MSTYTAPPRPWPARFAPWRREGFALARLALPLALIQLAQMAMVTTDVVLMGWLGPEALAAGALASHYYNFFEFFGLGLLGAVAPILSQHLGARRFRQVRRTVRQGFWLAAVMALPSILLIRKADGVLVVLGQDPALALAAQSYLDYLVIGILPAWWLVVVSGFLAAHARPRAALVVMVLGIGVNGLADYGLMFGHFGLPALGLAGAGIASAAVNSFMFLALLGFVLVDRRLRRYVLLGRFWRPDWPQFREIVGLGLPMAVSVLAEMGMFLASTLLMGLLGTVALAAHAIAIQGISIVYMVPLGVAQAATVRVGRAIGAGDAAAAARAGWTAMALGFGFAFLPALTFWFQGAAVVDLYLDTSRPQALATAGVAVSLLAMAALFQFADAVQVTAMGALRGLKDTRVPMLIALAGYWGLGLSAAAWFGVYLDYGAQAIWLGLALGLGVVALLLVGRFRVRCRRLMRAAAGDRTPRV